LAARYRGRLVAITQFNIVLGILLAFFSNYIISGLNLGAIEWRWMFGVEAFPALAFFFLLFHNPRSPRWLVAKDCIDEAKSVLEKCSTDTNNIAEEIQAIKTSLDIEHGSLQESFLNKKYIKPLMLAIVIAMFNQLSGINAILYFSPRIFKMAGAGSESALLQAVAVGGINMIMTMIALAIIDNFGRKKLMLVGSVGYILSLGTTAWAFYTFGTEFTAAGGVIVLISLLVFIASHAFGQGAVIWVFISEIFPNRVRARGQALGSFTHWVMNAVIAWTFPMFAEVSGGHTFAFYALCMVGQLLWVIYVMPETKGISLEQIQKKLGIE
jgi:SP family xylose:H+ symportor-like MFS transporter